ncbi:Uridine diphosphate glucose pyrophosphatase, partial [Galemys pyrenaicus]
PLPPARPAHLCGQWRPAGPPCVWSPGSWRRAQRRAGPGRSQVHPAHARGSAPRPCLCTGVKGRWSRHSTPSLIPPARALGHPIGPETGSPASRPHFPGRSPAPVASATQLVSVQSTQTTQIGSAQDPEAFGQRGQGGSNTGRVPVGRSFHPHREEAETPWGAQGPHALPAASHASLESEPAHGESRTELRGAGDSKRWQRAGRRHCPARECSTQWTGLSWGSRAEAGPHAPSSAPSALLRLRRPLWRVRSGLACPCRGRAGPQGWMSPWGGAALPEQAPPMPTGVRMLLAEGAPLQSARRALRLPCVHTALQVPSGVAVGPLLPALRQRGAGAGQGTARAVCAGLCERPPLLWLSLGQDLNYPKRSAEAPNRPRSRRHPSTGTPSGRWWLRRLEEPRLWACWGTPGMRQTTWWGLLSRPTTALPRARGLAQVLEQWGWREARPRPQRRGGRPVTALSMRRKTPGALLLRKRCLAVGGSSPAAPSQPQGGKGDVPHSQGPPGLGGVTHKLLGACYMAVDNRDLGVSSELAQLRLRPQFTPQVQSGSDGQPSHHRSSRPRRRRPGQRLGFQRARGASPAPAARCAQRDLEVSTPPLGPASAPPSSSFLPGGQRGPPTSDPPETFLPPQAQPAPAPPPLGASVPGRGGIRSAAFPPELPWNPLPPNREAPGPCRAAPPAGPGLEPPAARHLRPAPRTLGMPAPGHAHRPESSTARRAAAMERIEGAAVGRSAASPYLRPLRLHYHQNGVQKSWDFMQTHDSVAILLFNSSQRSLVLVKQFRPGEALGQVGRGRRVAWKARAGWAVTVPPAMYASEVERRFPGSLAAVDGDGPRELPAALPGAVGVTCELCAGLVDQPGLLLEEAACKEAWECGCCLAPTDLTKWPPTGRALPLSGRLALRAGVGLTGSCQTLFYAEVTDAQRAGPGGGLAEEGELIEVLHLPLGAAQAFSEDPAVPKTLGVIFGISWFLSCVAPGLGSL